MDVEVAAYNLVNAFVPGKATALAPLLEKAPGTLSREINPRYPDYKLGLLDAVKLSVLTGDRRILEAFAAEMNCLVVQVLERPPSAGDSFAGLGQLAKESADLVAATCEALADSKVTGNELLRLEREASELMAAVQAILAQARASHLALQERQL